MMSEAENNTFESYNANQRRAEAFFRGGAISYQATPPGSPAEGNVYIVLTPGSGAWSGQNEKVAEWLNGAWTFYTPLLNDTLVVSNPSPTQYRYNGTAWVTFGSGSGSSSSPPIATLLHQAPDPASVPGAVVLFARPDNLLYKKVPNGTTTLVEGGGASSLLPQSSTVTTATLPPGGIESSALTMAKTWVGLIIQTSAPAEIRIYQRASDQAADASRSTTTVPTVRVMQATTSTGNLTLPVEVVDVFGSTENPRTAAVPVTIFNRGTAAAAITLTFTYLPLEL